MYIAVYSAPPCVTMLPVDECQVVVQSKSLSVEASRPFAQSPAASECRAAERIHSTKTLSQSHS